MKRFLVVAVLASSAPAAAHIELDFPKVRYDNGLGEINKNCPCGGGSGGQLCSAGVTSDPNRDDSRATTLHAGASITVQWRETIGHTGRFRVAFDPDGADLADFNANILADIADPNDGSGARSVDVVLPDTPCDHCTLQLIQDMNGDQNGAVGDPTGDRTYFQCADLVLLPGGNGEHEGPAAPAGGCSSTSTAPSGAAASLAALAAALAALKRRRASSRRPR